MRRRPLRPLVLLVVAALLAAGCATQGEDGYLVTAEFDRAAGLFERSRVQVMGVDAGIVETVAIADDHVLVTLRIDDDVPLPDDVTAAIVPRSLIGERVIQLSPAYTPGATRLVDGAAIPPERTRAAVEPDDVLEAATDLLAIVENEHTAQLIDEAARLLDGRGDELGDGIDRGARIAASLRDQDVQLLELAASLEDLASRLNAREQEVRDLVAVASTGLTILTEHRGQLEPFLRSLLELSRRTGTLLAAYEDELPEDLATLTAMALRLEANTGSVNELVASLPALSATLLAAYRPEVQAVRLRLSGGPTVATVFEVLATLLGIPLPPCPPTPDLDCVP